jgi:hypothetical protein
MNSGKPTTYVGINQDIDGGMTDTGRIIREAGAFGLVPETGTCAGWNAQAIENRWCQTLAEWAKYNHQGGQPPDEIRERFLRIQQHAFVRARATGWDAKLQDDD